MNKALGLVLGLVLAFGIIGCEKVEQMVAPVGPIGEEVGEVTEEPTVEIIQTDNLFELVGQEITIHGTVLPSENDTLVVLNHSRFGEYVEIKNNSSNTSVELGDIVEVTGVLQVEDPLVFQVHPGTERFDTHGFYFETASVVDTDLQ